MFDIDIYFYIYPVYKALKLELQSFYKLNKLFLSYMYFSRIFCR